jgi:hypothetical protein
MIRAKIVIIAVVFGLVAMDLPPAATWAQADPQDTSGSKSNRELNLPVNIAAAFVPSGYMGDGERSRENVRVSEVVGEKPRPGDSDNTITKVEYQPGPQGWAGVYWLSPADNWGEKPGYTIIGKPDKITFWAAGARGNEIVEFKAGGVWAAKRYSNSFEVSTGPIHLTTDWKQYRIDLKAKNLSSVLGGFAWVATGDSNPHGLIFYLDEIRYE